MNYTIIVLVFIILMMLYMAYVYMTNTTLTTGVQSLNSPNTIAWTKLQNPGASTYHYDGWLYIKAKPTTNTTIFARGAESLQLNGTQLDFVDSTPSKGWSLNITDDFPLQKWVYFVINVVNANIVEVYLNGKLVITKQLKAHPANAKTDLVYGSTPGMDGYITKFKRDPGAFTPDEAWKSYLNGNGLASFSNFLAGYNASFSLYNTEGTIKQYTLL